MDNRFSLAGKVAVVTGANGTFGRIMKEQVSHRRSTVSAAAVQTLDSIPPTMRKCCSAQ